jgi:hypothetical protein
MPRIFKVLLMVFGLSQLLSCGQNSQLSGWLGNDKKLSELDSKVMSKWLLNNDLKAEDFKVIESPKGHSGEFSVIVADRHIQSIKAQGVNSLKDLSALPQLTTLDLNNFIQTDLSDCPPQLKSLRVAGDELLALDGVESCQKLAQITAVHSKVSSLAPIMTLTKLESIKVKYSQLSTVDIDHSVPELKFMDLSDNQINHFDIQADLPLLETLVLDNNQLTTWKHNNHTPVLTALSISNNKVQTLETVTPINSLKRISLKGNPLHNLVALSDWPNLQSIDYDGDLTNPSAPINRKITQLNGPLEKQIAEAEYLKERYLKNTEFIENLPNSTGGKAYGVSKNISSRFDLHSDPTVSGSIKIDTLSGLMRLPVVSTDDLLQYDRKIVISGTVTVKQGVLNIYSPIEQDFWDMAKLFVDTPIKQSPKDRDDLVIKGFTVDRASAGETIEFSARLVAIAGKYFLLLGPEQREAKGIHLEFE